MTPAPQARRGGPPPWLVALLMLATVVVFFHVEWTVRRPDRARLSFDSAEYAVAGRHLARTGTLATPFAHPALLPRLGDPPFPLVTGHPLAPLLDAALFALAGPRAELTLVAPTLAYLGVVVLAAWLALRLSGSVGTAWCAGLGAAFSGDLLRYAADGMSELPFTFAWTGALLLLYGSRRRPSPGWVGVLLGIAQLARPVALPLLPVWLAGLAWSAPPGTRTRAVWRCLAGFAPFAAGLAAYTWATTGSPFTASGSHLLLVGMEPRFTVGYLNCTFPPIDPATYLAAHPGALAHKLAAEGPRLLWAAFTRESGLLGLLLLSFLSALVPDRRPFAWTLVALMVGTVGLAALTVPNARFVVPFAPVLWAVGAAEAFALARPRLPGPATLALGLALAVVGAVWPSVSRWRHVEPPAVTEREWDALNGRLAEVLPPGPVASDVGPWISWGTGRITTLLPNTPDQLPALAARLRVAAVVVSNEWVVRQPGGERWRAVLEGGESVAGWPTAAVVTAGRLRARVLVREIPH